MYWNKTERSWHFQTQGFWHGNIQDDCSHTGTCKLSIFWGSWFVTFIPFHSCIDFVSFRLTFGWELNTWLWEYFPATCKFITQLWEMKQSVKANQSLAQNSELVKVINTKMPNARTLGRGPNKALIFKLRNWIWVEESSQVEEKFASKLTKWTRLWPSDCP